MQRRKILPRILESLLVVALALPGVVRAADHLPRTWTNSAGIKKEGTLVRVDGNKVTLLLDGGQMIEMPLDKLSAADQQYISDFQKKEMSAATPIVTDVSAANPAAPAATPATAATNAAAGATPRPHKQSILTRPALIHAPDPSVQPNTELYITFPELGKSHTDEPMGMHIRIPKNYRPDRPVPLLIWLAGGDGNNRFNDALPLVDQDEFVVAGINYPASAPLPQHALKETGGIEKIWDVQEKMLLRLQQMIPNIDPRLRIIVGFSNGAHVIGGCIAQQVSGLYDYFNVYVMIEGGDSLSFDYPALPGRYCYIADGATKEGYGKEFNDKLAGYARKAGMKVEAHMMEGTGHDFPDTEKGKVRAWLRGVMIEQLRKP